MRILVFGGSGLLGRQVVQRAVERGHDVSCPSHQSCDIANSVSVLDLLRADEPRIDRVINCAGVIDRQNLYGMVVTNALGPHVIQKNTMPIHVTHVSTDCVYSGRQPRNGMWNSAQNPDPADLYGRTKLTGEISGENALTVRTSFLGMEHGLFPWIVAASGTVDAWTRAYWNGGSARAVADALLDLSLEGRTGLLHLGAPEPVPKAWIVEYVAAALDKRLTINLTDTPRIWRALEPDVELPPVKESLDELLEQVK